MRVVICCALAVFAFVPVFQATRSDISSKDAGVFHTCCIRKGTEGVSPTDVEYQRRAAMALTYLLREGAYDQVGEDDAEKRIKSGLKLSIDPESVDGNSDVSESHVAAFFNEMAGIQAGRQGLMDAPTCDSLGTEWVHEESDDKFRCHGLLKVRKVFDAFIAGQKLLNELQRMTEQRLSSSSDKFTSSIRRKCCVRPDGLMKFHSDKNLYLDWAFKAANDMLLTGVYTENAKHGGNVALKYGQHMQLGVKPRSTPADTSGIYPDPGTWRIKEFYNMFTGFTAESCSKGTQAFSWSGSSAGEFPGDWVVAGPAEEFRCSEAFDFVNSIYTKFEQLKEARASHKAALSR